MVVNRGAMKRKRKSSEVNILLDESPKRTKVQAQRKFAQGSHVHSPVLTPIEEIETPERSDVLPEPQEFDVNAKRPHTEDFLTFLCFRGTPILPQSLNFFNTASADSRISPPEPLNAPSRPSPIATGIGSASSSPKPFIAFGVRKRADPVVISKQMDRKRRHALALQALRRKYQEQKMAKIRAITISKLSEKVSTSKSVINKDIVRTRSITKTETITKKKITQKNKVKVVSTKRLTVTTAKNTVKKPICGKRKPKMCLRSFRGRYAHQELTKVVKKTIKKPEEVSKESEEQEESDEEDDENEDLQSSEFSSDDDMPLVKKSKRLNGSKQVKKQHTIVKNQIEANFRLTRSTRLSSSTKLNRKVIYTKANVVRPRRSLHNKIHTVSLQERRRTRAQMVNEPNQKVKRSVPKRIIVPKQANIEAKSDSKSEDVSPNVKETRSKAKAGNTINVIKKSQSPPKRINKSPEKSTKTTKLNKNEKETKNVNEKEIEKHTKTVEKAIRKSNEKDVKTNLKAEDNEQQEKAKKDVEIEKKSTGNLQEIEKNKKEELKDTKTIKKVIKKPIAKAKVNVQTMKTRQGNRTIATNKNIARSNRAMRAARLITQKQQNTSRMRLTKIVPKETNLKEKGTLDNETKAKAVAETKLKSKPIAAEKTEMLKQESSKVKETKVADILDSETDIKNEILSRKMEEMGIVSKPKTEEKPKKTKEDMKRLVEKIEKISKNLAEECRNSEKAMVNTEKVEKSSVNSENKLKKSECIENKLNSENKNAKTNSNKNEIKADTEVKLDDKVLKIETNKNAEMLRKDVGIEKLSIRTETVEGITKIAEIVPKQEHVTEITAKSEFLKDNSTQESINEIIQETIKNMTVKPVKSILEMKKDTSKTTGKAKKQITKDPVSSKNSQKNENNCSKSDCSTSKNIPKIESNISKNIQKIESNVSKNMPENESSTSKSLHEKLNKEKANIKNAEIKVLEVNDTTQLKDLKEKDKIEVKTDAKKLASFVEKPDNLKLPTKQKTEKLISIPSTSQRPSRKTKEAATIYMEILSHKLVNEGEIDDGESIDSFPELPNVRKTEQREIELKANICKEETKITVKENNETTNEDSIQDLVSGTLQLVAERLSITKVEENTKKPKENKVQEVEKKKVASIENLDTKQNLVKKDDILPAKATNKIEKCAKTFDKTETEHNKDIKIAEIVPDKVTVSAKKIESKKLEKKGTKNAYSSDSEKSTASDVTVRKQAKKKKKAKVAENQSFSDSDEEPLSKFTKKTEIKIDVKKCDVKKPEEIRPKKVSNTKRKSEEMELPNYSTKREKRECAKRPQNYLTMFSSSDEDEKDFLGFAKIDVVPPVKEDPPKKVIPEPPVFDLLCKDMSRRFSKQKVNMSNERITQWLADSEKASIEIDKEQEMEFEEKPAAAADPIKDDLAKQKNVKPEESAKKQIPCDEVPKLDIETLKIKPTKPIYSTNIERKTIFRKENKISAAPNAKAFSVSNESSVYAFEAEMEDIVSTPFRRPSRRPSSSTFNSEDENVKDEGKPKFRQPSIPRMDQGKHEDSNIAENEHDLKIHGNKAKVRSTPERSTYMCPPSQKAKNPTKLLGYSNKTADYDDFKYKVPSSPSASSSSSAKMYNKRLNPKPRSKIYEFVPPVQANEFPGLDSTAQMVEAPVFHPTDKEFQDPIEYIEKIRSQAEKFGICKIVPPSSFKPECKVADDMRFTSYNQYVNKMLHRWGPNFKELMAIKKYLKTQNITLNQSPWIGGMEVDLPRLYQTVQTLGGLKEVIEKKKWAKVSDAMKIPKSAQDRVTKLDDIYCKYLLPYDTLSPVEREKLFDEVETDWAKRESRTLQKAQEKNADNSQNSDVESEDESEECIVKGRNMALNAFYRIARNTMSMWFKTTNPPPQEVEQEFWKHVTLKQNHICVHSGSIDSGSWGYGFAVTKNSPFARHAWNLKVLTNNSGSVLRSMGPLMGVTVPTLHVGMVFSTCCWYRDPHGLPWIEYLHTGSQKIWYGVPNSMRDNFHSTVMKLVPNYCRNKSIWLPSDTVMIPPNLLVENGVSLCRTVQAPGEYIVIFPKVFTSSLSTGYVVSESVYIAPPWWLCNAQSVFDELRANSEPSMFSFDRLLMSVALDARSNIDVLRQIQPLIERLCLREIAAREVVRKIGVVESEKLPPPNAPGARKRKKLQGGEGDFECEVCRTNLFVTLINETQEDLVYCVDHAVEIINEKKMDLSNCRMLFTYDDDELKQFVQKLESLIQSKLQKKTTSKFAGMPTLLK